MRYVYFAKVYLSAILIMSPLYVLAQCNKCCNEQKTNLQTTPNCDTYITNSRSSKTLESIDDKITTQVKDLLANESELPSITVTTANGVVILSGSASNQDQIDKAADLAASVPCVTEVDTSKFYVQ